MKAIQRIYFWPLIKDILGRLTFSLLYIFVNPNVIQFHITISEFNEHYDITGQLKPLVYENIV